MKRDIEFFAFAAVSLLLIFSGTEKATAEKVDASEMRFCMLEKSSDIKHSSSYLTCCDKNTKTCYTCDRDEKNCQSYPYQPKRNIVQGSGDKPITKAQ